MHASALSYATPASDQARNATRLRRSSMIASVRGSLSEAHERGRLGPRCWLRPSPPLAESPRVELTPRPGTCEVHRCPRGRSPPAVGSTWGPRGWRVASVGTRPGAVATCGTIMHAGACVRCVRRVIAAILIGRTSNERPGRSECRTAVDPSNRTVAHPVRLESPPQRHNGKKRQRLLARDPPALSPGSARALPALSQRSARALPALCQRSARDEPALSQR